MRLTKLFALTWLFTTLASFVQAAPQVFTDVRSPVLIRKVDNIAALRLLVGGQSVPAVQLSGYYTDSDGGAGPVRTWDAAGTCTDDGGACIDPDPIDANPGRWIWEEPGNVNIRWYGAKGNGSDDDHDSVQNAVDYCIANDIGTLLATDGTYFIGSQITIAGASGALVSLDLKGNGIETTIFKSGFTGTVTGLTNTGYLFVVDGLRNSVWSGFTIDYSVVTDATSAGRGGIVGVSRKQSFYNNTFDRLYFIGGDDATDRETDTRRSIKIVGNESVSDSTGYASYFNKISNCRFNIAYTHVDLQDGDGAAGTLQPNANFIEEGNLFERYIIAINLQNADEAYVGQSWFQQAAGVVAINGGETYCVYSDGEFVTMTFSDEPGADARPFALGPNSDRVYAVIQSNTSLPELIDVANTGRVFINLTPTEMEGLKVIGKRRPADVNFFGSGTAAHTGTSTYYINVWRKGGSTDKLALGFDDSSNQAKLQADGQDLNLTPAQSTNDTIVSGSTWDGSLLRMGNYRLWVDGSGRLRIKASNPTSDTDGTIIGTQS